MVKQTTIDLAECAKLANNLRTLAGFIENGQFAAFAFAISNEHGDGWSACVIDSRRVPPELIDEMADGIKRDLYNFYKSGKTFARRRLVNDDVIAASEH